MSQGLPNVMLFKTKQGAPVNVLASESADLKKLKKRIARQVKGMKKDADGKFIKDPAKPIKVLDDHNFQAEIAVGTATAEKVVFVKFYRTGCNHCQALKPIWEKMGKEIVDAGHKHVVLAEVECETNSKTCSKEGVSSHPTLIKYTQEEMKKEFPGEVYQMKKESPDMKEFVLDPAAYKVKLDKVIADDKKEKDAKKKEL
jgi:thiol-disulfide isomerase/thioredoxin